MTTEKLPAPRLASLASTLVAACEALRACQASPNHPWTSRWASLLDSIEANLLPSGSGFDNGTKIDREATNARRISLTFDFHHMNENGFYDGWTSHNVTIYPMFGSLEVLVSGRNKSQIRDYAFEVFASLFAESNQVAYTFDDQGQAVLIPKQDK